MTVVHVDCLYFVPDGGEGPASTKRLAAEGGASAARFQQAIMSYLKQCGMECNNNQRSKEHGAGMKAHTDQDSSKGKCKWGDKYPKFVGLSHDEPSKGSIEKFHANMMHCPDTVLKR